MMMSYAITATEQMTSLVSKDHDVFMIRQGRAPVKAICTHGKAKLSS